MRKAAKIGEEAGEVLAAIVKRDEVRNNERAGSVDHWDAKLESEVGDLLITLLALAFMEGLDLEAIAKAKWYEIENRRWI